MHVHMCKRRATHTHTHTHKTYLLNTGRELSWGEETKELSNKVCILVVGNGQHILPVRVIYHRAKPLLAGKVTFMTIPSASRARNRQPRITRHLRKAVIKTERETQTQCHAHIPQGEREKMNLTGNIIQVTQIIQRTEDMLAFFFKKDDSLREN